MYFKRVFQRVTIRFSRILVYKRTTALTSCTNVTPFDIQETIKIRHCNVIIIAFHRNFKHCKIRFILPVYKVNAVSWVYRASHVLALSRKFVTEQWPVSPRHTLISWQVHERETFSWASYEMCIFSRGEAIIETESVHSDYTVRNYAGTNYISYGILHLHN